MKANAGACGPSFCPPSGGSLNRTVTTVAPETIVVNNRNLGKAGNLSNSFGSTANSRMKEKRQLTMLMAKAKHEQYQTNHLEKARLNTKIAVKAATLYGMDPQKLKSVQAAVRGQGAATGVAAGNQKPTGTYASSLAAKVNGRVN
jgi:hypothetical protein